MLRKIATGSKKVSEKYMLKRAEQLYEQITLMKPLMWLGYVARNHFKVIVLAVLGAAEQNSGANAAAAAEARDQTMRPHDSTHTDWLTCKPTATACASGAAKTNKAADWDCVALSGWAVVTVAECQHP